MVGLAILKKVRSGNRKPIIISSTPSPSRMADSRENHRLASDSPETHTTLDTSKNEGITQVQDGDPTSLDSAAQSALNYHCIFYVLPCEYAFDNSEDWKAHVLEHFKGHTLPVDVRCPWCGMHFDSSSPTIHSPSSDSAIGSDTNEDTLGEPLSPRTTRQTGSNDNVDTAFAASSITSPSSQTEGHQIWHSMLDHIAHSHINPNLNGDDSNDNEEALFPTNNYTLMQYLYWSKSISEDKFKAAVQLVPAATPLNTTSTNSSDNTLSSPISPTSPAYRRWSRRYSQHQDEVLRASVGSSDEPFVVGYSPRRERRLREQQQLNQLQDQDRVQSQSQSRSQSRIGSGGSGSGLSIG